MEPGYSSDLVYLRGEHGSNSTGVKGMILTIYEILGVSPIDSIIDTESFWFLFSADSCFLGPLGVTIDATEPGQWEAWKRKRSVRFG